MDKFRATESIREILLREVMIKWIDRDKKLVGDMWNRGLFEPLKDRLTHEIKSIQREMHSKAVFIVEEEWNKWDVEVTYKDNGRLWEQLPYMMPMLEAEAYGRIETLFRK